MSMKSLATTSVALLLIAPLAANADKPTPVEVVNANPIPTQDVYAPGRIVKRYGPVGRFQAAGSPVPLVGVEVVPPVPEGETVVILNVMSTMSGTVSFQPLETGFCVLQMRRYDEDINDFLTGTIADLPLSPRFSGNLPTFLPIKTGEALYVRCFGEGAQSTPVNFSYDVLATGYVVPAS